MVESFSFKHLCLELGQRVRINDINNINACFILPDAGVLHSKKKRRNKRKLCVQVKGAHKSVN